ncbi:MAG: ABC transporter permease [Acidobacteriaceae bacterium]
MSRLRRMLLRFARLFSNDRAEADLAREVTAHLTLMEDDFRRQGMPAEEARLAARRAYGGVEQAKQLHRDERSYQGLAQIVRDIRHTLRQLRNSPAFTATAILMLALGIGATTAIFSIVEGVLLRPLPFSDPGRLVVLGDILDASDCAFCARSSVTAAGVRNYMRDVHTFDHVGGFTGIGFQLSGDGDPMSIMGARMSGEVFSALGVAPLLGRYFTQQEDNQNQQVAVLSYGLWRARFHGDPHIVGQKILLDHTPYTVTGVMPRDFEFPLRRGHLSHTDLWVPLRLRPEEFAAGSAASWNIRMVGRLKPGVTAAQAQSDAERVAQETMRNFPSFMRSIRIHADVRPLEADTVDQVRPLLRTLFLAVTVVLLIACANLAGLLLVRSMQRRREIAVRLALGAGAATLLRQAIIESLALTLSGGVLGLALAAAAVRAGVGLLPESLPRVREIGLDWTVVGFALGLALVTGLLCGLAPAFAAIRTNVNETLKAGGRTGTPGSGHARLRSGLVIAEVAVAMVLLTASGLLLRSFERMRAVDPGFRPDHTLSAFYYLRKEQYPTQPVIDEFNESLLRNLGQQPGVAAAGITSLLPASNGNFEIAFTLDGYVPPKGAGLNMASMSMVIGDPFRALGMRLLRGRLFNESDRAGSQLVAIVNRKLAQHYWPGQDPIGKRLRRGMPETTTPWMTVVGEVDDVKLGSLDKETAQQVYQPVTQAVETEGVFAAAGELSANYGYIVLRTGVPSEQMENALRSVVRSLDTQLPLEEVQTMEHAISGSEAPRRFNTVLISSFALFAVLLSVLGIYSVIAFSVALREQEMAVRLALGCQRSGVQALVLRSGMKLAAAGCGLGLVGALAASRLLRSFLFEVSPFDPAVLALCAVAMLMLALASSAVPARRAAATDPMQALRGE